MSDHATTITEWAQYASSFRKLQAYTVSADGTRQPLEGDALVIELDGERSLILSLSERREGEGVALCSLPQADGSTATADPEATNAPSTTPSRFSILVMRSGGANLLYVSPELHGQGSGGPREEQPEKQDD